MICLLGGFGFAEDGNIPHSTLETLGLGGMEVVSDEAGAEVRGMSGYYYHGGIRSYYGSGFAERSRVIGVSVSATAGGHAVRRTGVGAVGSWGYPHLGVASWRQDRFSAAAAVSLNVATYSTTRHSVGIGYPTLLPY
jgi:hypothetical protein